MSTVVEIESAIRQLPQDDFQKLAEWMDEARARQLAADAHAEQPFHLWQAAQWEIESEGVDTVDDFLVEYSRY